MSAPQGAETEAEAWLEELSLEACRYLLRAANVGRIAFMAADKYPVVFPVNYRMIEVLVENDKVPLAPPRRARSIHESPRFPRHLNAVYGPNADEREKLLRLGWGNATSTASSRLPAQGQHLGATGWRSRSSSAHNKRTPPEGGGISFCPGLRMT